MIPDRNRGVNRTRCGRLRAIRAGAALAVFRVPTCPVGGPVRIDSCGESFSNRVRTGNPQRLQDTGISSLRLTEQTHPAEGRAGNGGPHARLRTTMNLGGTMMTTLMRRIALVTLLLCSAALAQAQTYNLTLTGASPGGLWSRIGGGLDAAIAAAYPGSTVTYQTSSGGPANIAMVSRGAVPMGMATDGDLVAAVNGQEPFKSPVTNVRVLFRPYAPGARFQATHLLLNKDFADKYNIKSFADIVRNKVPVRVAINRRGNSDSDVSRRIMEELGASVKDIESWGGQVVHAASREIVSLMLDRRIDLANYGIAYKHPTIREIAQGITPVLLDVPQNVAAKVAKEFGGEVCMFKKGEYDFSDQDVHSVCIGSVVVAPESMPDDEAYAITKAVFTKMDQFKTAHRLIEKHTTRESLSTPAVVPFHPGSARYLKEVGLMK